MNQNPKPPLYESVQHLIHLFGISGKKAMDAVQERYDHFKERNQKLIERQNNQQNTAQIQMISHFALLATLTLTVIGFLITQNARILTIDQQKLVIFIMSMQVISLFFGAIDYLQTIRFHYRWANVYHEIEKEVDDKFNDASLQKTSQLNEIEASHLENTPKETRMWITYTMLATCLVGLALAIVLFFAYYFDVPIIK